MTLVHKHTNPFGKEIYHTSNPVQLIVLKANTKPNHPNASHVSEIHQNHSATFSTNSLSRNVYMSGTFSPTQRLDPIFSVPFQTAGQPLLSNLLSSPFQASTLNCHSGCLARLVTLKWIIPKYPMVKPRK